MTSQWYPLVVEARRAFRFRALEWLLLGVAAFQFFRTALPPGNADLISIQSLALDFRRGETSLLYPGAGFYRNDEWIAHHELNVRELGETIEPNWCFYPPLVPFILSPIAAIRAEYWRLVWGALQILWLVFFVIVVRRLLELFGYGSKPSTILLIALLAGSHPVVRSFELGQTSLGLALILWIAVWLTERSDYRFARSLLVAVSGFIKPFLLIADVPMMARRKWRAVIATAVAFVLLVLISLGVAGVSAHVEYLDFLATLASSPTAYYGNQSLLAGVLRLFSDLPVMDYGFLPDSGFSRISLLLTATILIFAVGMQWRFGGRNLMLDTGWWLSVVLLALPLSWEHHLLFLLPVIALLWLQKLKPSERVVLGIATALTTLNWTGLYADDYPGRFIASFPLIGNLCVCFVIGSVILTDYRLVNRTRFV